jgi:ABC-type multidrug transport system fused ATPase/permease subunit
LFGTGQKSLGTVVAISSYASFFWQPIMNLGNIFNNFINNVAYLERIFETIDEPVEIADKEGAEDIGEVLGKVEFDHVTFSYDGEEEVLKDVSFTVEPGQSIALVGPTGAGKSTIVNLLDKFYQPQQGTICLDGVPLNEWDTEWLRENVGLVLQKNHIFDGSIEENIKYGCPKATHDDVVRAAKQAYIYDQIMQLPHGFETEALQLSGGQQQRVAIARMFIKNPPIIFLDEPTASLDAIATEQIKASIDAIKKGRTVIIISHNIGQIIDADQIYVLQQGRVVQSGEPSEVYQQGGLYKDIFDASARSMNADKIAATTNF